MDLKIAVSFVKRHVGAALIVALAISGAWVFIWNEYKDLLKQKDPLAADRKSFNEEKTLFEKVRADFSIEKANRQLEINKQEFALQQQDKMTQDLLLDVKNRATEYNSKLETLRESQRAVSEAQQAKQASDGIKKMMSEFAAMGIDLNDHPYCDDLAENKKYNMALVKYSEIYTMAEAYNLTGRYSHFLFKNGRTVI